MDGDPSMGTPDNRFSELVGIVKSWIPRRTEPANLSRDFWMPDQSCRVCYDCDSQFTLFNRRHHCRLCGRVFCAKCTANSVPAPSDEPNTGCEDWERIRVCNYCFKQWEQGKTVVNNGAQASSPGLSPSPSATSLVSTKSTATGNSGSCTVNSMPFSTGPYQQVQYSSSLSPRQSSQMEFGTDKHEIAASGNSTDPIADIGDPSPSQFVFCMNRSDDDDEDDEYGDYQSDSEARHFNQVDDFYGSVEFDEIDHAYEPHDVHSDAENIERTGLSSSSLHESLDSQGLEGIKKKGEETEGHDHGDVCEASTSLYGVEGTEAEPVDFENNGLLWVPPEPEDEEDEREAVLFGDDDDDDDDDGAMGEWGYLRSSSNLGSGEYRSRDRSSEEHRKAMKNVVDGHFRALVSQLLQVENLPMVEEDDKENWLEIVTSLSWEAATLLKPDTSKSGGMDPGGYVKVKCIACGHRSESMVVKGVVCKKNVAHRRMASKIEKPRFLILGGALEYQRVSNLLSSFDTLLQQEMDHLKMAVAKIDAHHPNVLLVEKSVSRFAQDYLLAKDISLVLNIKRPLLERIARCMGAQIVPSIDHLSSQKLGYCDSFHVEKFLEEHGSAGQGGKKLVKTLMFFEDCPKPLGCTILLKGANGDELKKVKHVVQYGVFAAYHLALETSFLADEGASLPELPLKSPITVALPDKPSSIDKSISTIPDFAIAAIGKCQGPQSSTELQKSGRVLTSDVTLPIRNGSNSKGASLPELPLKSPITVALPDKPSSIDKSISTIPDFAIAAIGKCQGPQSSTELQKSGRVLTSDVTLPIRNGSNSKMEMALSPCLPKDLDSQYKGQDPSYHSSGFFHALTPSRQFVSDSYLNEPDPHHAFEDKDRMGCEESFEVKPSAANCSHKNVASHLISNGFGVLETSENGGFVGNGTQIDCNAVATYNPNASELASLQHDSNNYHEGQGPSKEEFPPSPSDNQSILVSLSTRCVWKGTVCERAHLFRIKYYGNFDKPLGRFLRDHLFDQSYCCHSCEMPSEAHVHCYTHRQGSVTISVKKLPEFLLPGEREGKIWMWHRCLRCPRTNGFPPATQRVVMSDAAWGLSFGKFLELSFSNHAAASRVASCGHSLHRDCLRFYGFGRMVACFRYGSIDVHSVYLPPSKLDFNYGSQEWIQKEAKEVVDRTELLFTEVLNSLHEIVEKRSGSGFLKSDVKAAESRHRVAELEGIIQKEKAEFEESLHKALNREAKNGQPIIDILEINRLQRQLLFQSYVWDRRLIYTANLDNDHQEGLSSSMAKSKEKTLDSIEKLVEMNTSNNTSKALSSCDSLIWDGKPDESLNQGGSGEQPNQDALASQGREMNQDPKNEKEGMVYLSTGQKLDDQFDPLESGVIRRVLSEGHFPIMASLSDTLDAAWTGENHPGSATPRENGYTFPDAAVVDSSVMIDVAVAKPELEEHLENRDGAEISQSLGPARAIKGTDNVYDTTSWVSMPFLNFYRSFNKISSGSVPKLDTLSGYDPVYVTSFRDLERQGGARFLLPIGFNDTVVPVYDDETTSIISYALLSQDYHAQMSDERDRPKDGGDSLVSLPPFDLVNFHSFHLFDEMTSESFRSLGSTDDSILSMSGSRSSLMLEPLLSTKALHVRVSVTDDGPLGKVRYTVTCYYAKRFEALRRTCCPFELDFIRSLSRCKKWGAQGGKSNVFFAKTLDDRFIVKQVTKTELESFIKFAPEYFKYLSDSIGTGSPTCLAKILGIYQVTSKHLKGGKESRMDVLVMENLLFGRNVTRLYDLKGSSRSRYNPDSSGTNKVLLDQNLIETMPTSPIFVGNKAKRLLERAVWNDTSFLASIDVMDYSLLVGVDEEKHELVVGIIDFMRQYTWDKHLETWVKASGILGGPKNSSPTVISPKQYKKRFRKAMSAYFLMVPDQWSPSTIIPNGSQLDVCEENAQGGPSLE